MKKALLLLVIIISAIYGATAANAATYFDFRSDTGTAISNSVPAFCPQGGNCKYIVIPLGQPSSTISGFKYYRFNPAGLNIMGGGCSSAALDIAVYNDAAYTSFRNAFGLAGSGTSPLPISSDINFDVPASSYAQLIFGCNDAGNPPLASIDGSGGTYSPRDRDSIFYSGLPNLCIGDTPQDCGVNPPSITSIQQFKSDGITPISEGSITSEVSPVFTATLQVPDSGTAALQIELEPSFIPFRNVPTMTSSFVSSGATLSISAPPLTPGGYHWQARAIDAQGNTSPWQSFTNPAATEDFAVLDSSLNIVLRDGTTLYGISTQPNTCFGNGTAISCPLTPEFQHYVVGSSFPIAKIAFNWRNTGGNNCDGLGSYGAIIASASTTNSIIASSSDAAYLACAGFSGGTQGTASVNFNGQTIPANFYLSFGAFDGVVQGGANITVSNVTIYSSQQREPVVIVPGIIGTTLDRTSDGSEVWPNVTQMLFSGSDSYLDDLGLDINGNQIMPMNIGSLIQSESIGPFSKVFYGNLIDAFVQDGYSTSTNLFTVPYDWRLDVNSQIDALASAILQAASSSVDGKVNIIAHSLGGLLVKKYLSTLSDTSFVSKVILVGVPQLGAPKAFKVLGYGDNFNFAIGPIDILNSNEVQKISQSMPSVYQLLPSRRYVQVAGSYVQDFRTVGNQFLTYDETSAFLSTTDPASDQTLLSNADLFHQSLDGQTVNASNVYNLVGCSEPTISQFNIYDNNVVDVSRGTGDGTVPETSAMNLANGYVNYFGLGLDHIGLISDPGAVALIRAIIDNTTSTSPLPQNISTSLSDCVSGSQSQGSLEFSTHSPVALNVYDSRGRHTGPNASGTIDLQIPGSSYETLGENSFILVPAGNSYKVLDQGLASGTFEMKVKGYSSGAVTQQATYLNVPLESASTTGELDFSGFEDDLGLKVSNSGNGNIDAIIQPNAVLTSASSLADVTPPTITMPNIASTSVLGTPITFAFSATDSGSGVATTSATLDGSPVVSGAVISTLGIGPHTFAVKAIDNAGNPAVQSMTFNVIYHFGGFLPPVKADGSAIYNLGRTLPLKFQLTNATGNFISSVVAQLVVTNVQNGIAGTTPVDLATSTADIGNLFRYDSSANQYIYNLATGQFAPGTWQLKVVLDDGTSYAVPVSLKSN